MKRASKLPWWTCPHCGVDNRSIGEEIVEVGEAWTCKACDESVYVAEIRITVVLDSEAPDARD